MTPNPTCRHRLRRRPPSSPVYSGRHLALLRHLGGGPARRRGRRAGAPGQPGGDAGQMLDALTATAPSPVSSVRPARRRRDDRRGGARSAALGTPPGGGRRSSAEVGGRDLRRRRPRKRRPDRRRRDPDATDPVARRRPRPAAVPGDQDRRTRRKVWCGPRRPHGPSRASASARTSAGRHLPLQGRPAGRCSAARPLRPPLRAGRHVIRVKARDAAGGVDRDAGRLPLPRQAARWRTARRRRLS